MESSGPASIPRPVVRKRLIDELTRGRDSTNMLRVMLCESQIKSNGACKPNLPAQSLIDKILNSFDESILILNCSESNQVSEVLTHRKSKDSGERVCHKIRRTLETRASEIHAASFEDGHAWRKYGQKRILLDKHPRSYFRCTHKYDQECRARKQVQKIQDDPPLFRTTHYGHHTCRNLFEEYQIVKDTTDNNSSIIWSFNSDKQNKKPNDLVIPTLPMYQQENKKKVQNLHQNRSLISPSDLTKFENFEQFADFSSATDHEHLICSDVSCWAGNTINMEIEMMLGSVFNDCFEF